MDSTSTKTHAQRVSATASNVQIRLHVKNAYKTFQFQKIKVPAFHVNFHAFHAHLLTHAHYATQDTF